MERCVSMVTIYCLIACTCILEGMIILICAYIIMCVVPDLPTVS